MKKSYTVKEVVKLEDKLDYLNFAQDALRDTYFPYTLATCIGMAIGGAGIKESAILALVMGGALTLLGATKLGSMMSAESRSERLRDRLDDIYKLMGPEFEKKVEEEYNKAR